MNKKIIIALIIVVLIALAGIVAFSLGGKSDTQITFLSGNNIQYGGQVEFELKDAQGNGIANQELTITLEGNGINQTYSIVTDSDGKGGLLLDSDEYGSYNITVTYNGADKYNPSSASQIINIGEENFESGDATSETSTESGDNSTSTSSSESASSSSELNYDSELNVKYDSNGKIVGGQNDGMSYEDLKNNPPEVDEDGNLV